LARKKSLFGRLGNLPESHGNRLLICAPDAPETAKKTKIPVKFPVSRESEPQNTPNGDGSGHAA